MKKLFAFFDGDGTLWRFGNRFGSSWDLVELLLTEEEKRIWRERSEKFHSNFEKQNAQTYKDFFCLQVSMLKNKAELDLNKAKIPYVEGAKEAIEALKTEAEIYLISAGFYDFVKKAADELGINYIANPLEKNTKDGKRVYTGKGKINVTPFDKHKSIEKILKKHNAEAIIFHDIFDFSLIDFKSKNVKKVLVYDAKNKYEKEIAKKLASEKKVDLLSENFYHFLAFYQNKK
jgi:phosphoserine phosphatase